MDIEVDKTRTDETRWTGVLTGEQIVELLLRGLRDELYMPHHGITLSGSLALPGGHAVELCDTVALRFVAVHDHEWWAKREAAEA